LSFVLVSGQLDQVGCDSSEGCDGSTTNQRELVADQSRSSRLWLCERIDSLSSGTREELLGCSANKESLDGFRYGMEAHRETRMKLPKQT
tara:strand:- start:13479 stop:13748 length:270 start_codon:yes stop_codon:yes gene_type:complete